MKKTILFFTAILMFAGGGCDTINPDDRQIEMDEVIPLKKVLLLDFTDQACPNCPEAGSEVALLKEKYGNNLVPVTIHASYRTNLSLVTEDGNTYDVHFGTKQAGHPAGVIDGKLFEKYEKWTEGVSERFNVPPSLTIDLSVSYEENNSEIHLVVKLKGFKEITNAKLLLWIIEDNIIDQQLVGKEIEKEYEHHYIFRAAINGTWGNEIAVGEDEEKEWEYEYTLSDKWKPEDISIVGFVYDADSDEVFDVNEVHLKTSKI
jgi:hypothetical protein